ncbi:glycosyltransferase like 2 family protein [Burkholderia thailandensis 34]|uniref:glycosyltransferase family 2 protein n=1 Tax=Burkholderia thailandensis TaxID=57975 RepID=UPI0005D82F88|nr:glycosyltransferase family 2 protein [Burkholderia thailandensis]AJY31108.1 glycosyltransferase like 2 family protein [Burkholderia thailandensis 34]AOJ60410.1 glycosyl transferase [Burkholderia thailandensis]KXF57401.1 glycosyl transferase [Burkholderia thailandensis]PNE77861.1 glycosyltransferase family 2 protein [Burkholderia thailandensis]
MLLTIAIPTYNRAPCLRMLVDALLAQIAEMAPRDERVEILIADNASNDGTGEYLRALAPSGFVTVHRHAENRGAAANVVHCFRHARSRYVWIIGDDDLPLPGAVDAVLRHLASAGPDLFLLPAKWVPDHLEDAARACARPCGARRVGRIDLARKASVMTTFISSWVVNREAYLHHYGDAGIDRFGDTLFPQLAWVFGLMRSGARFLSADGPWLLARAGNSGNYAVFDAFSHQYNRIVDQSFADAGWLRNFHRQDILWNFIPGLVWSVRTERAGRFEPFDAAAVEKVLSSAYAGSGFYMRIVLPMITRRAGIAKWYWVLARILRRVRLCWIFARASMRRRIASQPETG